MAEKVLDITKDERMFLSGLKRRPGMYLGKTTLTGLAGFVHGYKAAMMMTKPYSERVILPDGLNGYAAMKYIGHTRTVLNCFSLILEKEPDEKRAFYVFWNLLDEYLVTLGYEPIPDWDIIREEWENWQRQKYTKLKRHEKNCNITSDERMLISSLKRRPGMYLGTTTLTNFINWTFGYTIALRMTGLYSERVILPDGIVDHIALKYLGSTEIPSNDWLSIIFEKEPDEEKAFLYFLNCWTNILSASVTSQYRFLMILRTNGKS